MLFTAFSCRKTSVTPEPPVDAAPAPLTTASADFNDASVATVSAWTDAPIVDKLRADCGFDPRKMSDAQKEELFGNLYGANQLTCSGNAMDQSCVYDPCFEGDLHDCRSTCLSTCDSCDANCTGSCFACKANCKDDACRNACAPTCAQCKQTCITEQDRCRSGKCGQVYGDCRKRLSASWKAQNCSAVCTQYEPCRESCFDRLDTDKSGNFDHKACIEKCKAPLKTSCDLGLCGGKSGMGIEP